jgi:hypothetical protein
MHILGSPVISLKLQLLRTIILIRKITSSWGKAVQLCSTIGQLSSRMTKALGGVHANLHTFLTSPRDSSKAPDEQDVKTKCSVLCNRLPKFCSIFGYNILHTSQ